MIRNYFLFNVLLFTVIVLLGFKFYDAWTITLDIPDIAMQQKARFNEPERAAGKEVALNETAFNVIAQKNLFNPSRSIITKGPETPKPLSQAEKPQLFGTMIMNSTEFAIFENPSTKKTGIYYVDDKVDGFVVADIQEDKVMLMKDGGVVEVMLRDDKKFKAPTTIRRPPGRVQARPVVRRRPAARAGRR